MLNQKKVCEDALRNTSSYLVTPFRKYTSLAW